ncbi:MAG: hypothetical protein RQ855_08150 [Desulfurococcales archaeon]|nr:hypothetical protein [Desulfurococcales archaeon]
MIINSSYIILSRSLIPKIFSLKGILVRRLGYCCRTQDGETL